ncbi:hypothetical protein JXM83_00545 [Candidatus Woesearchaeota archaeon]|nr:hypothetical protein [Candidatus Woesearchaeota archaeon]
MVTKTKKTSKIKKEVKKSSLISGILIVSIAIITFLFTLSGTNLFFDRPQYDDYCQYKYFDKPMPISNNCSNDKYRDCGNLMAMPNYDENGCIESYTCSDCNLKYNDAQESFSKKLFALSIIIGIILILVSAKITIPTIQNGIFISSILTIIRGCMEYWSELGKIFQFLLLGVALTSIIIIAYKTYLKKA